MGGSKSKQERTYDMDDLIYGVRILIISCSAQVCFCDEAQNRFTLLKKKRE